MPAGSDYFNDLYEVARTGHLDEVELKGYIDSMVTEYDKLVIGEYFFKDGMEKGMEKGRSLTILEFIRAGAPDDLITQVTGMSPDEISKLRRQDSI